MSNNGSIVVFLHGVSTDLFYLIVVNDLHVKFEGWYDALFLFLD
jgi:hypothetical protein